jgi:2-C-methyl-D-erythritol 4-phosphate cytidylyltransferase/2-C-methyl-D-erythritol 2,4-cyclodiphosphate synthase
MGFALIIPAAGSGSRLGASRPKAFVESAGQSLLAHAVGGALRSGLFSHVIVAAPVGWLDAARSQVDAVVESRTMTGPVPQTTVIAGGRERWASVRAALEHCGDAPCVFVHDAARPAAGPEVFGRVAAALAAGATAVVPVLPVVDTLRTSAGDELRGGVDRESLRRVQTPQGFRRDLLVAAYAAWDPLSGAGPTDDAGVMEAAGHRITAVAGEERALKVTYPSDLRLLAALDPDARTAQGLNGPVPRVGTGVDVHAFSSDPERPLMLAGLEWPGGFGLAGHSDADVAAHACADALFAAAGLGDLGEHFGVDRPEFAGAPGTVLLAEAARIVRAAGFTIGSVAVQIVCNRPKVGRRRDEAQEALGTACGAPVAVAGTTSDGLGSMGRGEGATAIATAVLY